MIASLEGFFATVSSANPFLENRVNGLTANSVHVDDIHRTALDRVTTLALQALEARRGLGAMVWGEAGIGKSHLLAQLTRWAETNQRASAVYLHNLSAHPDNLARSLLKAVVSILTRGQRRDYVSTPLYDLVWGFIKESVHYDTTRKYPWRVVERAFDALVDRLGEEDFARAAPLDRTVFQVFYQFFRSAYRACKTDDESVATLAIRWLSGDYLDPKEASALGLPRAADPEQPAALADNQQIKQVLVGLSRMALSCKQPFLLCFDQVDNLDSEQASAFSRFLEALLDCAPNMLVVTAGIKASLLHWHQTGVIQDSAWDRLAQFCINLQRLTPMESQALLEARLRKWVTSFGEVAEVRERLSQDKLFPLGQTWAEEFFQGKIDLRPREVINGAREGWQRQQDQLSKLGGELWLDTWGQQEATGKNGKPVTLTQEQIELAIETKVGETLTVLLQQPSQMPHTLEPNADNLAGMIASLLKDLGGLEIERAPEGKNNKQFPFSLCARRAVNGVKDCTGILVLVSPSATSTTAALRGLVKADPAPKRIVLVTDQRVALAFGDQANAKGRDYYQQLTHRDAGQFRHLEVTVEQQAKLAALHEVIRTARGGDLEITLPDGHARSISEAEAIAALRCQNHSWFSETLGAWFF